MRRSADLTRFDLGPMVRLVSALRQQALAVGSMESWAQGVSQLLHETLLSPTGQPQTALVRVYVTSPLDRLPPAEQDYVRSLAVGPLAAKTNCLALLGTSGTRPEWNDRTRSTGHRVLPLRDAEHVARMPMIAALLEQLGIDVHALAATEPQVMLKSGDDSCRIFFVPDAAGSELIPAQDFVADNGIAAALGFGGALPTGEVFAVVMFTTVEVPLPSAELFETVALSMRLAALDLLEVPLYTDGSSAVTLGRTRERLTPEQVSRARADLSVALLHAHEQASAIAADRVQSALDQASYDASRASALAAVAYRLNGGLSVKEIIDVLITEGLPPLGGDGLSLALLDGSGGMADMTVSEGFGTGIPETYSRLVLNDKLPIAFTARTGQAVILEDVLVGDHPYPELIELARTLDLHALVSLPLWVGDRLIGAMTCRWNSPQQFRDSGIELMQALAAQAAQAIDRSRLLEQERQQSAVLQRSLLTDPPEPDHCHIVVRYQPAAQLAQVGGDWYDSFVQQDGATVLVIGDVVGHDVAAAAAMGQVRGLLRGTAWATGAGPAAALTGVDRAMTGLLVQTTASAVVARIEQTDRERDEGITRLRWSSAGHPPPMVLRPDGSVDLLSSSDPDLLLGIDPDTPRTEHEVQVERGSTLVLYTDGLIERRGQDLDEGLARLRDVLTGLADLPLEEFCDELLQQLTPDADDDIALLVLRLHDQDQPRPPEAGPRRLPAGTEGLSASGGR